MAAVAPRPLRSAAPLVVLAAGALAFDADPRLPWIAGAAGALLFGGAAAVRAVQAASERRRLRRTADRLILAAPAPERSELIAWRTRELTAQHTRTGLRREIERTERALSPARLPSASPLNRPAARRNAELLRALAHRLDDGEPVSARGVLVTRQLLRDASSPLYSDRADELLPRALSRALGALEP